MPSSGWMRHRQPVALQRRARRQRKHQVRRAAELDDDLAAPLFQRLAGAQIKRHALPAPVLDEQLDDGVGRRARVGRHALLGAVAGVLAGDDALGRILRRQHRHGVEHLDLLVAQRVGGEAGRRLHRRQRQQLQQVVLEHVAQHAGLVVVVAAAPPS